MAKRKSASKRTCKKCGEELTEPRVRTCKRCRAKAAIRVMPDGRRIDLKALREKRKALKSKPKVGQPIEDDRVAQTWDRTERRQRATIAEQEAVQRITGPWRAAERQAKVRAQTGSDSATPARMAKAGTDIEIGADKVQRVTDAPLDALRKRKDGKGNPILPLDAYEAGRRYAEDFELAGMESSVVSDPSRLPSGFGSKMPGFLGSPRRLEAWKRLRDADEALCEAHRSLVQMVALDTSQTKLSVLALKYTGRRNENEARASFYDAAKVAFGELARHYAPPPRPRMVSSGQRASVDETQWERSGSGG